MTHEVKKEARELAKEAMNCAFSKLNNEQWFAARDLIESNILISLTAAEEHGRISGLEEAARFVVDNTDLCGDEFLVEDGILNLKAGE